MTGVYCKDDLMKRSLDHLWLWNYSATFRRPKVTLRRSSSALVKALDDPLFKRALQEAPLYMFVSSEYMSPKEDSLLNKEHLQRMDSSKGLTVITRRLPNRLAKYLEIRKPAIQTLDSKVEHAHWNMTNLPNAQITARSVLLALFKISLIKSSFELLMIKPLNFKVWKFRDWSLSTQYWVD